MAQEDVPISSDRDYGTRLILGIEPSKRTLIPSASALAQIDPKDKSAHKTYVAQGLHLLLEVVAKDERPEQPLGESYLELLCRRCFVYDCRRHGINHPLPKDREQTIVAAYEREIFASMAHSAAPKGANGVEGEEEQEAQGEQGPRKRQKVAGPSDSPARLEPWSSAERRLFSKLWKVCRGDLNVVSRLMGTRSVEEVKEYHQELVGLQSIAASLSEDPTIDEHYHLQAGKEALSYLQTQPKPQETREAVGKEDGDRSGGEEESDGTEVRSCLLGLPILLHAIIVYRMANPNLRKRQSPNERSLHGPLNRGIANCFEKSIAHCVAPRYGILSPTASRLECHHTCPSPLQKKDYFPCDHDGPCTAENCSCVRANRFCERFCACGIHCGSQFPGTQACPWNTSPVCPLPFVCCLDARLPLPQGWLHTRMPLQSCWKGMRSRPVSMW